MAGKSLDAFLELTPNQANMRVRFGGESMDAGKGEQTQHIAIEIWSFGFGNAKALAEGAKDRDKKRKKDKEKDAKKGKGKDDDEEEDDTSTEPNAGKAGKRLSDNFRFQITKQVEKSSPYLMQAYYSNSYGKKRPEYNDFESAKVTIRKLVSDNDAPKTYVSFKFGDVRVIGYTFETQGADPPLETVEFGFRTCQMKYKPQANTGEFTEPIVRGWDFGAAAEVTTAADAD